MASQWPHLFFRHPGSMFAEVSISVAATTPPALPLPLSTSTSSIKIGIDLPSGVRLTVDSRVDADLLKGCPIDGFGIYPLQ